MARFTFVGTPIIPKETAKRPFCKESEKTDSKTRKKRQTLGMTFGIKASDTNMAFVECFDSTREKILTYDGNQEKIEISWDDRLNEEQIAQVANFRKFIVDLGEDFGGRQEFITAYDAMEFLKEMLPLYKGKVMVTGQFTKEWYAKNKTYFDRFRIQNVYAVSEDKKSRLSLEMDIYYDRDSLDKTDFKEKKKVYLDGYIEQYMGKDEGKKMIPMQFVFSAAKYDLVNNEKHKKQFDYKMSYLDINKKNMVHALWEIVLLRGAEEVDFNESMLTPQQKEQIELGLKELEDFKPRGSVIGERINEYRLFVPKLVGEFADGLIETDETPKEFSERVYQPPVDETLEEAKTKSQAKAKSESVVQEEPEEDLLDDIDDDDLF